jgi:hypothetical protein
MTFLLKTPQDAYQLMQQLGATPKLLRHVQLVGEAAELLVAELQYFQLDDRLIRLGVAIHDAGKILHPQELSHPGNQHEADGETLLLSHGVEPAIARCCRSHAQWQTMACSLEELMIALADNLWKGKRNQSLEDLVIRELASRSQQDYWYVFMQMDACFEQIAAGGDNRLLRSQI